MAKNYKECDALKVKLAKIANKAHDNTDGKRPHACCVQHCNLDVVARKDWDAYKQRDWKAKSPQRTGIRLTRRGLEKHTGKSPVALAYIEAEYGPQYRGRGNSGA